MPLEISWLTGENHQVEYGPLASQSLTISGTSAQSNAGPQSASIVTVYATEAARFELGQNPTAAATSTYIGANERRWVWCKGGDKVAGITA